jgi:hypothetical protein
MNPRKKHRRRPKRKTPTPEVIYVYVEHDPYDNSIGGPNDYAYGM